MARKGKNDVELVDYPTVVWFDPGGTTGWSVISVHPEALIENDVTILDNIINWTHGQIVGDENEQASAMLGIVAAWPGCCVGHEDFILGKFSADRELLSPVRITAKVEFGLFLAGGVPYFRQMPSEAKKVATDERLRSWGLYEREGGQGHARDADRHAITWIRKCKQYEWMRRQCWPYLFGPGAEFFAGVRVVEEEDEELA
jgi:hypothetical protein